jgi:hypothetical protein
MSIKIIGALTWPICLQWDYVIDWASHHLPVRLRHQLCGYQSDKIFWEISVYFEETVCVSCIQTFGTAFQRICVGLFMILM